MFDRAQRPPPPATEVHATALAMLGRRALTARELLDRLVRKGFAEPVAREEVRRLRALGLLNEAEIAGAVARDMLRRGHGRRAAHAALRRRRVTPDAAEAALDDLDDAPALALALERAERRHPLWRRLPDQRRKVIRYLLARGFAASDVRAALAARRGDEGEREADQP